MEAQADRHDRPRVLTRPGTLMAETATAEPLLKTPLYEDHVARGARMVPFAGYAMPVQYPTGILAEHQWTRERAGLFDVSHMGQAVLVGPDHETTARAFETLVPGDMLELPRGRQRYTPLLNEQGGIRDGPMAGPPPHPGPDRAPRLRVNAPPQGAGHPKNEA